ncbi:unnamed protein product [Diplocarpon coronariae]
MIPPIWRAHKYSAGGGALLSAPILGEKASLLQREGPAFDDQVGLAALLRGEMRGRFAGFFSVLENHRPPLLSEKRARRPRRSWVWTPLLRRPGQPLPKRSSGSSNRPRGDRFDTVQSRERGLARTTSCSYVGRRGPGRIGGLVGRAAYLVPCIELVSSRETQTAGGSWLGHSRGWTGRAHTTAGNGGQPLALMDTTASTARSQDSSGRFPPRARERVRGLVFPPIRTYPRSETGRARLACRGKPSPGAGEDGREPAIYGPHP